MSRETSGALLNGSESLSDVLILRVEHGRDHFVEITGNYLKSSFGAPLTWLCNCPVPVRAANAQTKATKPLLVPKELYRLISAVSSTAIKLPGVFITNGIPKEVVQVSVFTLSSWSTLLFLLFYFLSSAYSLYRLLSLLLFLLLSLSLGRFVSVWTRASSSHPRLTHTPWRRRSCAS